MVSTGGFAFRVGPSQATNAMFIKNDGNVGIGTTIPTHQLVVGNGTTNSVYAGTQILAAHTSDARLGAVAANAGAFLRYNATSGYGSLFAYDYGGVTAKNLTLNEFGGNVGIGTTSPGSILYLSASTPVLTLDNTATGGLNQVSFKEGSVIKGGINQIGSTFTTANRQNNIEIINQTAAGAVSFWTNSGEKVRIDSSGNVGIGTTSPQTLLGLQGGIGVHSSQLYLAANGAVGIGTTAPLYKLHIEGTNSAGGQGWNAVFRESPSTGGVLIGSRGASGPTAVGAIQGVDSSLATNALLLNPFGGNVGIGTTGPVARLNVVGANAASIALISGASTAVRIGSSGTYSQIEGVDPTGVGSYQPLQVGGSTLDFTIAGAKKVSIDTNGNVGIGTTTSTFKLAVQGDDGSGYAAFFRANSTVAGVRIGTISSVGAIQGTTAAGANDNLLLNTNGGNVGIGTTNPATKLQVNGDIAPNTTGASNLGSATYAFGCLYYTSGTLGTCASDARLKTDIQDLTFDDPLTQIAGLHPRSFAYLAAPGSTYHGLVAQEAEQVAPELVVTDASTTLKAVKYGDVQWLVVSGIKQLWAQVKDYFARTERLESEVRDLNARVRELESRNGIQSASAATSQSGSQSASAASTQSTGTNTTETESPPSSAEDGASGGGAGVEPDATGGPAGEQSGSANTSGSTSDNHGTTPAESADVPPEATPTDSTNSPSPTGNQENP
jgi:hypothetical protein